MNVNKKYNAVLFLISTISFLIYIVTLTTNYLATSLPLNGLTTGGISDLYPNLFTPSGITFSIWGVIYSLIFGFNFFIFYKLTGKIHDHDFRFLKKIQIFFILSSILNALWIVCWHFLYIGLSVLVMILLLISLIAINLEIKNNKSNLSRSFFLKVPFQTYFGWITVATIANITAYLVSQSFQGFGLSDIWWTVVILLTGTFIGAFTGFTIRSPSYLLVLIWAYFGILINHTSVAGFNFKYPEIIATTVLSISVFFVVLYQIIFKINILSK